jgi:hypothetical protein
MVATLLTLVLLPTIYVALHKGSEAKAARPADA